MPLVNRWPTPTRAWRRALCQIDRARRTGCGVWRAPAHRNARYRARGDDSGRRSDSRNAVVTEGFKQSFAGADLLGLRVTVEDMIAEGDKVVTRYIAYGTPRGDVMGIPARGKTFTMTAIDILRFEDGKITEHWIESDQLGMLQQLGVIPAPGQAQR